MDTTLTVSTRFAGPPSSGNGGYTAGLLAAALTDADPAPPVRVTLRRPPPLDTALRVETQSGEARLLSGAELVAEATVGQFEHPRVPAVSFADASATEASYAGWHDHPFPGCFVCGTDRVAGDGLALRPGAIAVGRTACLWRPDASLADAADPLRAACVFSWAALDCPGGWTSDLQARPLVLGRMTCLVDRLADVGGTYVVTGALLGAEGRKTFTATSLHDEDGRLLGRAEHVWIAVDPTTFSLARREGTTYGGRTRERRWSEE